MEVYTGSALMEERRIGWPILLPVKCNENGDFNFHIIREGVPGIKFASAGTHHEPGQKLLLVITEGEVR